jgi:cell division protein FtsB
MLTKVIAYPSELPLGMSREWIGRFRPPAILLRMLGAALLGVCSGVALAAWHVSQAEMWVTQRTVVAHSASAVNTAVAADESQRQIEKLQARNRRLEALITALHNRNRRADTNEP